MSKGYTLDPQLEQHFNQLEQQYNLPQNLLKSVAYTESRYNPNATSPVGASGMFQFMPATAKQYGVDTSDPYSSADGAARMYATLLKQNNGDLNKALAGYNWGQGNLNKKGLDNAPQETKNYISQINNLMPCALCDVEAFDNGENYLYCPCCGLRFGPYFGKRLKFEWNRIMGLITEGLLKESMDKKIVDRQNL